MCWSRDTSNRTLALEDLDLGILLYNHEVQIIWKLIHKPLLMSFLSGIVLTHLNTLDQQTDRTSSFMQVFMLVMITHNTLDQQRITTTYPLSWKQGCTVVNALVLYFI